MRTSVVAAWSLLAACTHDASIIPPDKTPDPDDPPIEQPVVDTGAPGSPWEAPGASTQVLGRLWRDLDHWSAWLTLTRFDSPWHDDHLHWGFDPRQRFRVQVQDGGGPLVDARVTLYRQGQASWTARTGARGEAELFGGLFDGEAGPWAITGVGGGFVHQIQPVTPTWQDAIALSLTEETLTSVDALDVFWFVDPSDRHAAVLDHLQDTIAPLLDDIALTWPGRPLRVGLSVLADDDQTTTAGLDSDPTGALELLAAIEPEPTTTSALPRALEQAAAAHWEADGARLALVVVDDHPTLDDDLPRIHEACRSLAEQGVRVAVVSTRPDPELDLLSRNLAVATNGWWLWVVTEGASGTDPWIGTPAAVPLSELLDQVVREAAWTP